jgi:hypothetical protein
MEREWGYRKMGKMRRRWIWGLGWQCSDLGMKKEGDG